MSRMAEHRMILSVCTVRCIDDRNALTCLVKGVCLVLVEQGAEFNEQVVLAHKPEQDVHKRIDAQ